MSLAKAINTAEQLRNLLKAFEGAEDVLRLAMSTKSAQKQADQRIAELTKEEERRTAAIAKLDINIEKKRFDQKFLDVQKGLQKRIGQVRLTHRKELEKKEADLATLDARIESRRAEIEAELKPLEEALIDTKAELAKHELALDRFKKRLAVA